MPGSMSDHQEAVDGTDSLKTLIEDDGLSDSQDSRYGANSLVADMDSYGTAKSNDAFPLNSLWSADCDSNDLLALRYLSGLAGDALITGVIASDAARTTSAEIEAHIQSLTPAL